MSLHVYVKKTEILENLADVAMGVEKKVLPKIMLVLKAVLYHFY